MLSVAILSFFVFVLVFGFLVIMYNKLSFKLKHHRFLGQINQQELNRLSNIFEELDPGAEFLNSSHVYAADLDLVEISPNADPPVCKIMNYGKYQFELNKKLQIAKKKQI